MSRLAAWGDRTFTAWARAEERFGRLSRLRAPVVRALRTDRTAILLAAGTVGLGGVGLLILLVGVVVEAMGGPRAVGFVGGGLLGAAWGCVFTLFLKVERRVARAEKSGEPTAAGDDGACA